MQQGSLIAGYEPKQHKPKAPPQPKRERPKAEDKAFAKKAKQLAYQIAPASAEETQFRHTHWAPKRANVLRALLASGCGRSQIEAFENCGSECIVEYDKETKKLRLAGNYCHNRHCEPCARAKANLLCNNLREKLRENPDGRYRFVTLTLLHSADPLLDQIKRLYAAFKKLRSRKLWKESQVGGAAILECKWNPDTGEWHPHLHIVTEGEFIRKGALSDEWHHVTGDSYVVDIRQLDSAKDAAYYVSKYVSKGTNGEVWWNQYAAVEWVIALKGVRTCATFGKWRGFKLLKKPTDKGTWTKVCSLNTLMRDAVAGQQYAISMLDAITAELQYNPAKKRPRKAQPPA